MRNFKKESALFNITGHSDALHRWIDGKIDGFCVWFVGLFGGVEADNQEEV